MTLTFLVLFTKYENFNCFYHFQLWKTITCGIMWKNGGGDKLASNFPPTPPISFNTQTRLQHTRAGYGWYKFDTAFQRKTNKELFAAKHQKHTRPEDIAYARNELEILNKVRPQSKD